jgi:hypothetical protein
MVLQENPVYENWPPKTAEDIKRPRDQIKVD